MKIFLEWFLYIENINIELRMETSFNNESINWFYFIDWLLLNSFEFTKMSSCQIVPKHKIHVKTEISSTWLELIGNKLSMALKKI